MHDHETGRTVPCAGPCGGGLGCELCVFVAGWRHALRSEWIIIIIIIGDLGKHLVLAIHYVI